MTKVEIALFFDIEDVEDKKTDYLDNILREKVYMCDEEEYSELCESMEEKGYCGVRLYPFCAKAEDEEGLKKALLWISENSQLIKNIAEETGVNIQLVIKFLVKNDLMSILGFFAGHPLELVFSSKDLQLLKDHNIDLKVTAEYSNDIDDDEDENGDDEEYDFSSLFNASASEDADGDEGGVDIDNQDFTVKSGVLTEYKGAGGDVVIPDGTESIGWNAFENHKNIITITIPNSVKRIGYSAFYGCSYLSSVNIPDSVTQIESAAFFDCKKLKDVIIPDSVKTIEEEAFSGCQSLTSIVIPNGVSAIKDFTFSDCHNLVSFSVPDGITEIGCCAFCRCASLSNIVIPESVTIIADNAFAECEKLIIHAPAGSYAEQYAKEKNIPFVAE